MNAHVKDPSVTIVVPTIGRLEYLPETKRSLEQQTRTDLRVVVLDNASPPAAQELLHAWAKGDSRVSIQRVDERVPMFANFNRGWKAAETPFVTFFHDDDVYLPRYLDVLVGALEAHPGAAFSGSNFDFIDETGKVIDERRSIEENALWSGDRYIRELIGRSRNVVPMPGLVFRRSAFPEGFDEKLPIYFGDFVLLMRAAEEGGMVACAEPVVHIRKHAAQASHMQLSKSILLRTEVLVRYLDELETRRPAGDELVRTLRRRVGFTHRAGLLWGWLSAAERAERDACLEGFGSNTTDEMARLALRLADRCGLRPNGARLTRLARTAARTLRI